MLTNKTHLNPKKIIIYSRDKMKQRNMTKKFQGDNRKYTISSIIGEPTLALKPIF